MSKDCACRRQSSRFYRYAHIIPQHIALAAICFYPEVGAWLLMSSAVEADSSECKPSCSRRARQQVIDAILIASGQSIGLPIAVKSTCSASFNVAGDITI